MHDTRFDRRAFLLAGTAATAAMSLPAAARRAFRLRPDNAEFAALLDKLFVEGLRMNPESATQLGLDTGANADLRAKLSDESPAGRAAQRALTKAQIKALEGFDASKLSPGEKVTRDVVLYSRRNQAASQTFAFNGRPYVLSQQSGAYQSIPDFLDTKHPIADAADAGAYLARLDAFAGQLDDNTDAFVADAKKGVLAPDFLLDLTLEQMGKLRVPMKDSVLVQSLERRAAAAGLDPGFAAAAGGLYQEKVLPALDRQIAAVKQWRAKATPDAGIWKLPHGDDYYRVALRNYTTTNMSPEEVHQFGRDQMAAISARLDAELRKQGMTGGTVGERLAALYKDPAQLYPNTDDGRAQAIAYCNERLAAILKRLPEAFHKTPAYRFEVRRVPPAIEAGASSAYAQSPSLDGSRPGLVYFNLRDTAEWPKFCLATTIYHEGLPGHQYEGGLRLANDSLPLIRKMISFSGYGEGWALYAEQLADEIGMYDDDPLGRLGYLKFQLFRAIRCVADTGIHHYKWSREQAVAAFVEGGGEAPGFAKREVERYCNNPGQACSYKLGHSVFVKLRDAAKAAQGDAFDLRDFHAAVLANGRVPLEMLETLTQAWIAAKG